MSTDNKTPAERRFAALRAFRILAEGRVEDVLKIIPESQPGADSSARFAILDALRRQLDRQLEATTTYAEARLAIEVWQGEANQTILDALPAVLSQPPYCN
jgi:hypothetical protein